MSKRQSSLLSFFTTPGKLASPKTPSSNKGGNTNGTTASPATTPKSKVKTSDTKPAKKSKLDFDDDDEEVVQTQKQKRKKNVLSSDSEEDNDAKKRKTSGETSFSNFVFKEELDRSVGKKDKEPTSTPKAPHEITNALKQMEITKHYGHNTYEFLKPDKIMDKNRNKPNSPNYNAKTLFVPQTFLDKLTPAQRQWWQIKSEHMDCVLFFKLGKFYELYHMDADVGVQQLGLTYMKSSDSAPVAHAGFPETAYGRMAACLVEKGFKVARVEQTESVESMNERWNNRNKSVKADKVVRREVCQITTKGTIVQNVQDTDATRADASYLLAFVERINTDATSRTNRPCQYGVCVIETTLGDVFLSNFEDDAYRSNFHTLLSMFPPGMIIYPGDGISNDTKSILSTNVLVNTIKETVKQKNVPNGLDVVRLIKEKKYFESAESKEIVWPDVFQKMLIDGFNIEPAYELRIQALGVIINCLIESLIDMQVLCYAKFHEYTPNFLDTNTNHKHMIIDANTLNNLRLVDTQKCLLDKLDRCKTAFGKRLLRTWLCNPLFQLTEIRQRQHAVKELFENRNLIKDCQKDLAGLPDLERLLTKIHALGNRKRYVDHPDARAVLFEEKTYAKKKVGDFIATLNGFERAISIIRMFDESKSALLNDLCSCPDMSEDLNFFKKSFDQREAKETGVIIPKFAIGSTYDKICDQIAAIERGLETYRKEQERYFECKVVYFGSDKKRYQMEIHGDDICDKLTGDYQLESSFKCKGKMVKRYSTPKTQSCLQEIMKLEDEKTDALKDLARQLFEKFSSKFSEWNKIVECVAQLDVLLALADFANSSSMEMCLPELLPPSNRNIIEIKDGRHPTLADGLDFIPNDISLGCNDVAPFLILTGPNMGGKSTIMRQTALIVVLAQMGSFVPASSCRLSLCDRIFTRFGARDDISQNQSTFVIELMEAKSILEYSTSSSLALLDELGRGTSTYDGTAIASAIIEYMSGRNVRTMFSTHYHQILDEIQTDTRISKAFMKVLVEDEPTDKNAPEERVTFLYKLEAGVCPKSYGFNAARLGGLPEEIIKRARQKAEQLELDTHVIEITQQLMKMRTLEDSSRICEMLRNM